jgi:phenylacetate-coenzyme A ligase PaaK-like adenylate-forming protein
MDSFDRIVTDPRLRRDQVEAHLAGADPGRPVLGSYRVFATAGTTGLRGLFAYSDQELATWVATCLRGMAVWGLTPATRLAGIGSPSPLHISNQLYAVLLAGRPGGMPRLTVTPLPEMVAAPNAYQPEALTAYPSIAAQLAEAQLDGQLRIAPTLVATTSEVLTADMRHRIHAAWSLDPIDFYGTTEAAVPAAGRQHQTGMDILEDLVIIESVDPHNHPVPPGTPGHKVLLTNLVNHAQPLIRYELTDSITLADTPNPLGLPYTRITAIDGRSDDIITLPAPAGAQVPIHPFRLRAPFAALPDLRQYQIHHDQTALHVRVVLRPSAARDTLQGIRSASPKNSKPPVRSHPRSRSPRSTTSRATKATAPS